MRFKKGQTDRQTDRQLDGVPRTQTSRLLLSYYKYTAVEATALLFVQQHVKGAIIVYHVTPPHGRKWPLYRMIVRELRQERFQQPPVEAPFQAISIPVPH